ncbi:uncharacterized protein LOC106876277 [Octopus bimaculoides]|uniref:Uncharacterized protein n=1 Tax=Octopus bimaculoides TaxID=37653 RepID=A0A0L8GK89_OCTBM|nr:uncharacterized protein LOC106876277 [Octopus bimaculoides]XP_014780257.1 uncharacterized protein LOC106876277 [Octopus bimaculoides]|eukprot:XP_014780256.1 PREDICTED: uncharacterized protein LOC106876277 [Octopus bimaculoides]
MVPKNSVARLLLIITLLQLILQTSSKEYVFKQYKFRKKRDDKHYRHAKSQCETSAHCQKLLTRPLDHTRCVRLCISEKCYNELYGHDELEEGEIDVRLNSFKGCYFLDLRSREM